MTKTNARHVVSLVSPVHPSIAAHCSPRSYFNVGTHVFRGARDTRRRRHHGDRGASPERGRSTPLRWKNAQLTFSLQYATCSTRENSAERKSLCGVTRSILNTATLWRCIRCTGKHRSDNFSLSTRHRY